MKRKIVLLLLVFLVLVSSAICFANQLGTGNVGNVIPMGVYVAECPRCGSDCYDETETGNFICDKCGHKFHTTKLK